MAKAKFIQELQALGYTVQELVAENRCFQVFDYLIPVGRFRGQKVRIGLEVQESFPMDAPPGPHFSPKLLPLHPGNDIPHPFGGVHASPLGADWQYWSRPFNEWAQTNKTVKTYFTQINHLLDTA
jgi:Prokaryotic E2 family E